jgi:methylglyoxal reductase
MKTTTFPSLDEEVSRLGFGAFGLMGVFGEFSETDAIDAIHASWESGVNLIDTARHYGRSEEIIGTALKSWSGAKPFIASKAECVGPALQWGAPVDIETCFPKGHITREAETSLRTLGVESIDLYQMHLYWANWGVEGYWLDELEALLDSGKVRSIGVSVPDHRHDMALPLIQSGRIHSVQAIFHLFDPTPIDCFLPACLENDVAVLARCVLDEGGLTGMLKADTTFAKGDFRDGYFDMGPRDVYIEKVAEFEKFIPEHASSLVSLALRYVTQQPGVTSALSSMHIPEYAKQNIAVFDEPDLPQEVMDEIRFKHRWIRNFYGPKVFQ